MSETNGSVTPPNVIRLSSGSFHVSIEGGPGFDLPILETLEVFDTVTQKHPNNYHAALEEVIAHVQEHHKVSLTISQADELRDELIITQNARKAERRKRLEEIVGGQS